MVQAVVDWFTPKRQMIIFVIINIFNYIDRGIVPGAPEYFTEFIEEVKQTETTGVLFGLLTMVFIIGYMLATLVFGYLLRFVPPMRVIGYGLIVHVASLLMSGSAYYANSYEVLLIARCLSGAGEAAFCIITPAIIDDQAPPEKKGTWLAILFAAIPVGTALGYGYGSFVSKALGWQWAFFLESLPYYPMIVFCFMLDELKLNMSAKAAVGAIAGKSGVDDEPLSVRNSGLGCRAHLVSLDAALPRDSTEVVAKAVELADKSQDAPQPSLLVESKIILTTPLFMISAFGQSATTAFVAGLSVWAPLIVRQLQFTDSQETASLMVGGIALIGGLVGTPLGGFLVDKYGGNDNATKLKSSVAQLAVIAVVSTVFFLILPWVSSIILFFILSVIGLTVIMCNISPCTVAYLYTVPARSRGFAMGIATMIIHLFGDVPAPVIIGGIKDLLAPPSTIIGEEGKDKIYSEEGIRGLRWTLFILSCWMFVAVFFWVLGYFVFMKQLRQHEAQQNQSELVVDKEGHTPDAKYTENTV